MSVWKNLSVKKWIVEVQIFSKINSFVVFKLKKWEDNSIKTKNEIFTER